MYYLFIQYLLQMKGKELLKNLPLFFIAIWLLAFNTEIAAQDKEVKTAIDKSFHELVNTPNDTLKVKKLIALFKKSSRERQENYEIIDSAISVAKNLLYIRGIGKSYYEKGLTERRTFNYYKGIRNQTKALTFLQQTTDTLTTIKCLNSIGVGYRKLNIVEKSFKYYFNAYKLAQEYEYASSMAVALNGIGNLFIDTKKYKMALYYFKKALSLELGMNNERGIEYDYTNIGEAYMCLGNFDSAHYYTQKAYEISMNNGKRNTQVYELSLIAKIYQKEKKYEKSNKTYEEALRIFKEIKNKRYIANSYINLGHNKIKLKREKEGVSDIQKGLKIALKIGSKENIIDAYTLLSSYYTKNGNYQQALLNFQKATQFKDSILNETSQKQLINTRIAYESYEKDDQIHQLKAAKTANKELAERNLKLLIYGGIIAFVAFVALLYSFFLHKKNAHLEIEHLNNELKKQVHQIEESSENKQILKEKIASFGLTNREVEILKLIMEGFTYEQIAPQLYISKNTVKFHMKNIFGKMEVSNRMQLLKKVEEKATS